MGRGDKIEQSVPRRRRPTETKTKLTGPDHNPWLGTLACLGPYALAPLSRLMCIMEGTHFRHVCTVRTWRIQAMHRA